MKKSMIKASMALALASMAALAIAADKVYDAKCLKCHGALGDGKGKAADLLDPKPTDFTAADWQAKSKDEDITEAITNGGKSTKLKIGRKMPSFGEKLKKEEIAALVTKVRSFAKK
jgi:mono/diheme cytochrome c family protein